LGWRETTIVVDLKFDPEPAGVFDAIPALKRSLHLNVELACPSDFLPPLDQWAGAEPFHPASTAILKSSHYEFSFAGAVQAGARATPKTCWT